MQKPIIEEFCDILRKELKKEQDSVMDFLVSAKIEDVPKLQGQVLQLRKFDTFLRIAKRKLMNEDLEFQDDE